MPAYLTSTGSYLPGPPIPNEAIENYIGSVEGEAEVRAKVLRMNGIVSRHYAQDDRQIETHDVYELGANAAADCLKNCGSDQPVTFLSAGSTNAPLTAPGIGSIIHDRMSKRDDVRSLLSHPVEISSHAGVCTSSASALTGAIRAVQLGEHDRAIAIGAEHSTAVLKASVIDPVDDRTVHEDVRQSRWFMSIFLRFMLSDGAGAAMVQAKPEPDRIALKVDWCHSRSFAHAAPLCMKLDAKTGLLSQDVNVLSRHLMNLSESFVVDALKSHQETLSDYRFFLPHLSSFFFERKMRQLIHQHAESDSAPECWTNLATAGNTGAASIYIMLDHFLREGRVTDGDRILLFVPESGQFNFVLISLTVVAPLESR